MICTEAEEENDNNKSDHSIDDDKPCLIMRPLFTTHQDIAREDRCMSSLFQTRICHNDRLCRLIIDLDSCTNVVYEDVPQKLGQKTKPHPSSYKVALVNNTNLKVHEKYLVTRFIGN